MAIVWPCPLSVDAYAAAGREIDVPRQPCPSCSQAMGFWGFYRRYVRIGPVVRLLVRRARCGRCRRSHAILPDFVAKGRLDGVEVIGRGIEDLVVGIGARTSAERTGLPHTTVRDWRRRVTARCQVLTDGFLAATVGLGDLGPRQLCGGPAGLVIAIDAAVRAARRRLGARGPRWIVANRILGAELCTTNTDPPFFAR